jgi:multimeric flavodoxin WrbA
MLAIALLGSPRKQGNSDILSDEVLRGIHEKNVDTEKIYLDDYTIRPIGEVRDNSREREDSRADDEFPIVLSKFLDAGLVILATPVYWAGVSAQLKCFIDRLSSYFNREPYDERFKDKGYVVVTTFGREDPDHGKWVTEPLKLCVDVLNGRYLGDLSVSVYEKGKVREMPDVLKSAYELGKKAVDELSNREKNIEGEHIPRRQK